MNNIENLLEWHVTLGSDYCCCYYYIIIIIIIT
jgi:hypothetical protein